MPLYARLWTDILDDPKLMRAAREGAKHLVLLPWFIAFAKRADADGRLEISGIPAIPSDIARSIPNVNARSVEKALDELHGIGVLTKDPDGCYRFVAWEYRNAGRTSDSKEAVAERVRRHRERKRQQKGDTGNGHGNGGNALHVTTVTSKRVERREEREESREKRSTAGSSERVSPAPRNARQLPPAAAEFGRVFYGSAPPSRKRDVKQQLLATLNGGATFGRGVKVAAGSVQRLEAKCRQVIDEGVKDPDKAIVVLLRKLADVGNAQDSPTEKAAAAAAASEDQDHRVGAERLALAVDWLEAHPDRAQEIDAQVDRELGPDALPPIRAVYRNSVVARAWQLAGEPIVQPTGRP